MRRSIHVFSVSVIVACASIFATFVVYGRSDQTRVVFLDVGQGDAILISRGSWQVLIDGGAEKRLLLEKLGTYMPFWDRTIDVMIATHPDADHIAAQIAAFQSYRVRTVIATEALKKSRIATVWREAFEKSGAQLIVANESVIIQMKKDDVSAGIMQVLFPRAATNIPEIEDINDTSIVTYLKVGETTFLMTGDLSQKQEANINVPYVTILKAGHHGSKTSSGEDFVQRTRPQEVVFSAGRENRYGHPAEEIVERFRKVGAKILRTDSLGDIVYICSFAEEMACKRMNENR